MKVFYHLLFDVTVPSIERSHSLYPAESGGDLRVHGRGAKEVLVSI